MLATAPSAPSAHLGHAFGTTLPIDPGIVIAGRDDGSNPVGGSSFTIPPLTVCALAIAPPPRATPAVRTSPPLRPAPGNAPGNAARTAVRRANGPATTHLGASHDPLLFKEGDDLASSFSDAPFLSGAAPPAPPAAEREEEEELTIVVLHAASSSRRQRHAVGLNSSAGVDTHTADTTARALSPSLGRSPFSASLSFATGARALKRADEERRAVDRILEIAAAKIDLQVAAIMGAALVALNREDLWTKVRLFYSIIQPLRFVRILLTV